jgi:hypothetical protein
MKRSEAVQTALLAEGVPDVPIIGEYFDDQTIKQAVSYQLYLASENRLILGTSNQHQMFDPERNITRAEAAVLLSRLSALKSRLDSIDDWKTGFGRDSLCSVKALPVIIRLKVTPESVVADGKSSINIAAQIWDQDGPDGISIVKADLSSLGGAQETAMFDDATHGDTISNDLVYSTLFPVAYELTPGQKSISVTVVDRNGWQASSSVSFMVSPPNFPPQILSAIAFPSSVRPGGKSMIAVKVYDQNGPEDIASVRIDLSGLGQSPALDLEDSGKDGDFKAGDGIFMKEIKIPDNTKSATLSVPVTVTDRAGQKASAVISLDIR